jgi:hypothetical protein
MNTELEEFALPFGISGRKIRRSGADRGGSMRVNVSSSVLGVKLVESKAHG